jgi:hypothetical protein
MPGRGAAQLSWGAAQLSGVQRSSVVSALGCCTAAPGSIPARHPHPRPTRMNYLPRAGVIPSSGRYPADEVQPEEEYCINVCLVRKIQNK